MKKLLLLLLLPLTTFGDPVGPGKLADAGAQFIPTVDMWATYCVAAGQCGPAGSVLAGFTYNCNALSFPGSPAGATQCIGAIPPAFQACRPSDADIGAGRGKLLPVDTTVSSYYTRLAVWTDRCTGKVTAQFATLAEIAEMLTLALVMSDAQLKAWTAAQPVKQWTPSEIAFMNATVAAYSPRAGVKPLTSTAIDAPVYVLNADGSRSTLSVPGKRAPRGTPCDMTKRISTTSYYLVPSLTGGQYYATCAIVSAL